MCGVLGVLLANQASNSAGELAEGLQLLQHRGQDACGIVTCGPKGRFFQCKSNGMVRDVLDAKSLSQLIGSMGVGHARYPTAGSSAHSEAQPFYVNSPYGIVLGHVTLLDLVPPQNGNLTNTQHLRYYLDHYAHRHINTSSDSELLLNLLADALQKTGKFRIDSDDIFRALRDVMHTTSGAYACVGMIAGFGIVGFRDPNGIRPLGWAKRKSETIPGGYDYLIASESVVCDALGFSEWVDVNPGETIIINKTGVVIQQCMPPRTFAPDMFEYVYFARPDSVLDGISVYRSRMAMGDALAENARARLAEAGIKVDVVIPVPDTSRVAALQVAQKLDVPYREGFVKNRYVGRTFIMPGQEIRRKNVRRKLNAMALEFNAKVVLIVDDSIVRGTTSKEIIQMARDAGAKKVIMASCAPPIRYPNVYGIDMPSRFELVAHGRTEEEISQTIGADLTIFQTLDDLVKSCGQFNPNIKDFDCSVFTGQYVTGGVDESYLAGLESLRSDNAKIKANAAAGRPPMTNVNAANQKETGGAPVIANEASGVEGASAVENLGSNGASVVTASGAMNEVHSGTGDDDSQVVGLTNAGQHDTEHPDLSVGLSNLGER
ncbi:BZ3500_MvSof-1268-A1-R1_Chr8-1g09887 [Microbotryum saponariae]|uniref:amidophosphoribosyltransferase n=1 Tax=Microbotryum saponariae TaxID=289078 RepID=A0A2X0KVN7_9BASI|nr:BZ3500_MvSof-1268-A1-R1_Chr8-1g09887 [Microbotryum saponariae]SDA08173.1 BZ3501_MvSof-1269-A2-R1_Chr8-1g09610 [Microbotryum saponariae]